MWYTLKLILKTEGVRELREKIAADKILALLPQTPDIVFIPPQDGLCVVNGNMFRYVDGKWSEYKQAPDISGIEWKELEKAIASLLCKED